MSATGPQQEPASETTNPNAAAALRERVKELTCLYGISQVAALPGASVDEILTGIVELLPPGWQYPEVTCARIMLDGRPYRTPSFRECVQKQSADLVINGERRGAVEVGYLDHRPALDEGPFLKEERDLIDAVGRQIGLIIERREAAEEEARLREQLIHADRLATIGQLAAGVAHELNEPLGGVLGFAQLARKCAGLPQQAAADIRKIETAALNARETIRKLLVFARQMPPKKERVSLNQVVKEGLHFLEARCAKAGIELQRVLCDDMPSIIADGAQLNQVLVNLVVNAIQAMPAGGKLRIETCAAEDHALLIVADTGAGMSQDVQERVFMPFFTTKDVGEGTGLGLAVVHGIVTSHGGVIRVESNVDSGTTFEVRLPASESAELEENRRDEPAG